MHSVTMKIGTGYYSSEYTLAHWAIRMASKHPGVAGEGENKTLMIPHKL